LLPAAVGQDQIYISRNGLNLVDLDQSFVSRNPRRVIYPVAYSRGLERLLRMWPMIISEVADAELHIFYGWQSVTDPNEERRLRVLLRQPRVFEHGQIGHRPLVQEYRRSGIFAYPSHTPEVFSISTLRAQACGCIPVVTHCGALAEVVKVGIVLEGCAGEEHVDRAYQAELIALLKDVPRQERLREELSRIPVENFSWAQIAGEWDRDILHCITVERKEDES
jgi:glycosyltransferase involved in cell wall biosynthesis